MQPVKLLAQWLSKNASHEHYLFTLMDVRSLFPRQSDSAFKTLMSRAVSSRLLIRVCRGVYLFQPAQPNDGLLLFRVAGLLRAEQFNYISLETALSDVGVISQIPFNWITVMSSGRSNIISCGKFGTIEYVHTKQSPDDLVHQLTYDSNCGLWRANVPLAIRDMRVTRRNHDLIDWSVVDELV